MLQSMNEPDEWVTDLRRTIARLERESRRGHLSSVRPSRRAGLRSEVRSVWIRYRYPEYPSMGHAGVDFEFFDRALRHSAYAATRRESVVDDHGPRIRLPVDLGLQLRGASSGSLEVLLAIPA